MNVLERLTPKAIILDAITKRLEGTNITKLVLIFNVKTDKYSVAFSQDDNKSIRLDIEQDDMNMLKKILINKLKRKIDEDFKKDYSCIILQISLKNHTFEVFIEDIFKDVHKFDF